MHTIGEKIVQGKGFKFHVVHDQSNTGLTGFIAKNDAKEDAADRNKRAKELGSKATYSVRKAEDGTLIGDDK